MRKNRNSGVSVDMFTDPIISKNEDGDTQRTVIWSESDGIVRNETTIIHKKVPSVGVILLTAFVFTVLGALLASLMFFARFVETKSLVDRISGRNSSAIEEQRGSEEDASKNGSTSLSELVTEDPQGSENSNVAISSLADIYDENVATALVIKSFDKNGARIGTGTGFFIKDEGYIMTNAHVVEGASKVTVATYDERKTTAEIIGSDVRTDIAVLKVEPEFVMKTAKLGNSKGVHTGDFVLVIGHPTGEELKFTATFGMVGAVDRSVNIDGVRNEYIQIDAAINPGNSGGPLFDMNGNVIGVNSAKTIVASYDDGQPISAEGLGFALPINTALETAEKIIADGGIVRPGIGLSTIFIDEQTAKEQNIPIGGLVYTVTEDGPAHKAGLYADDIITEVDGVIIDDNDALGNYIRTKKMGDEVTIKYWRDGEYHTTVITIGDLNKLSGIILDNAYGGKKYGID